MNKCFYPLLCLWLVSGSLPAQTNTFPSSGNVGIGTISPGAKLSFNNMNDGSNGSDGITWYNTYPLDYGIYRTPGAWISPNYQQLEIRFETGIILHPGTLYGRSFVDIMGGGLRVTAGNVGIGTATPVNLLDVSGIGRFRRQGSESSGFTIGGDALSLHGWGAQNPYIEWVNSDDTRQGYLGWNTNRLSLILENGYDFTVENGNVGIGTPSPNERLTVNGTIYGKEVKVDLSVPGPDYVFEPDYALPSLESINDYIKENKHLPEIPSAKEMEEDGLKVGEMNMLLLKKIEELTLHVIRQQEEIEKLRNEMHNRSDAKY